MKKLHTSGALRQRLTALGIVRGVEIELLNHTNLRGAYEIKVGSISIALGKKEAQNIEIG